ncbi:nucleotide pyrophosphohydrolase [Halobacteriovorax marinus]|uniref:Nucleotide pyrophosphohydrolase n=1 Tax=Halobacteriovorax marinus TaxID=97084 RepID=A0A1Y5FHC5_9BACT|nr:nucleotide pyrophosphohydrolase [Halobacteriovorax marinus]
MTQVINISKWKKRLSEFAKIRDWGQFHNPKNLVMAMSVECSELVEHFQWLTSEQSLNMSEEQMEGVKEEMADVLLYMLRLSDVLDVDIEEILEMKFKRNGEKYPAEKARGSMKKYDKL